MHDGCTDDVSVKSKIPHIAGMSLEHVRSDGGRHVLMIVVDMGVIIDGQDSSTGQQQWDGGLYKFNLITQTWMK